MLDPELDPIALIEEEPLELMLTEAESRLEPDRFFGSLLTQLDALSRLPRRLGQLADRLETGTLKIGVAPTGSRTPSICFAQSRTARRRHHRRRRAAHLVGPDGPGQPRRRAGRLLPLGRGRPLHDLAHHAASCAPPRA